MYVRSRTLACVGIAVAVLLVGCSSSGSSAKKGSTTTTSSSGSAAAKGVTSDSIKIGMNYVDTEALKKANVNQDLGDWPGAATALVNQINKAGGINGRKIILVNQPIDASSGLVADAPCVKLTEDDKVFVVGGFFLLDQVNCVVGTHATAAVGGTVTAERLAKAKAPWITWNPGANQTDQIIAALKKKGALKGKIGVFAGVASDATTMNDEVVPALKKAGVTPVDTAVQDAPVTDTAAVQNKVDIIAERFKSAGVTSVVLVGQGGANWPAYMQQNPYTPKLLFLSSDAVKAFTSNSATTNTKILESGYTGGPYGPDQAVYDEPTMQECVKTLKQAGLKLPPPSASTNPLVQEYQAALNVCPPMALLKAWLTAAGKDLNNKTLGTAINGLKVKVPGDPTPRTYSPQHLDGNPSAYLFVWDPKTKKLVLAK